MNKNLLILRVPAVFIAFSILSACEKKSGVASAIDAARESAARAIDPKGAIREADVAKEASATAKNAAETAKAAAETAKHAADAINSAAQAVKTANETNSKAAPSAPTATAPPTAK